MPLVNLTLSGELSEEQVRTHFDELHRDNSGVGTADGLEFRTEITFATSDLAFDWLTRTVETHGSAIAVRVILPRQDTGVIELTSKTGRHNYRVTDAWKGTTRVFVQLPMPDNRIRERRLRQGGQRAMQVATAFRNATQDSGMSLWVIGTWRS